MSDLEADAGVDAQPLRPMIVDTTGILVFDGPAVTFQVERDVDLLLIVARFEGISVPDVTVGDQAQNALVVTGSERGPRGAVWQIDDYERGTMVAASHATTIPAEFIGVSVENASSNVRFSQMAQAELQVAANEIVIAHLETGRSESPNEPFLEEWTNGNWLGMYSEANGSHGISVEHSTPFFQSVIISTRSLTGSAQSHDCASST